LQLQNAATRSYRALMRNNVVVTSEIERTAHGVAVKQMHFSGKIAGQNKTFTVAYMKVLSKVYVISGNADTQFASQLDETIDMMINTRKFAPIPA
jgi:uncharacterized RmlC-like cupin family protein